MTELSLIPDELPRREPIGWRCHWMVAADYIRSAAERTAAGYSDFPTREAAEAERDRLRWRDEVVVTVTPIWPRARNQTKRALRQALDAVGWPIQMAPPK